MGQQGRWGLGGAGKVWGFVQKQREGVRVRASVLVESTPEVWGVQVEDKNSR